MSANESQNYVIVEPTSYGYAMINRALMEASEKEPDDDPVCVCGTYSSEHALCGCPEGFQTQESWNAEREGIRERAFREADGGPYADEYDVDLKENEDDGDMEHYDFGGEYDPDDDFTDVEGGL